MAVKTNEDWPDVDEHVEYDELTEMEMSFAFDDGYEDGFKDIYKNDYPSGLLSDSYDNGYAAGIGDFYERYN